ncbi:hypothetical protein AHAS_Ahas09G0186000 [Arachis hypogaea]
MKFSSPKIRINGVNASELVSINMLMLLWNERPQLERQYVDMAGGIASIIVMKKRLESQSNLPITASGDQVSSSTTISHLPPPPRAKGRGRDKSEDTKLGLAKMPLEDTFFRVQKMFLYSVTYVRDAKVEISNLQSEFVVENLKKQVFELIAKISELDISVKNTERAAMDGILMLNHASLTKSNL